MKRVLNSSMKTEEMSLKRDMELRGKKFVESSGDKPPKLGGMLTLGAPKQRMKTKAIQITYMFVIKMDTHIKIQGKLLGMELVMNFNYFNLHDEMIFLILCLSKYLVV